MPFGMTESFEPQNMSEAGVVPSEEDYEALTDFLDDIAREELKDPNHETDPDNHAEYITDPEIIFEVVSRMAAYAFTAGRAYQTQFSSPTDEVTVTVKISEYLEFLHNKIAEAQA